EPENRRYAADLNANYEPQTMLTIIGTDEPLVRSYLEHFFIEEDSYQPYAPYVENNYLKRIFAITKIVNGQGDPERWYSMLTPAEYQQLKERVDLDFAHTNDEQFDADEPVSLDMWVK
ncbi:MAG: hypothetical protein KDA59_04875, partial [Planctomycetales bacterium]|nr:hypothetical protein [Planctomycetales bacterium]